MANVATKTNDSIIQWVTFRLADEIYGINVMQVQEVLRVSEIAPVPGAPHYVLGIINLRGNVVTVIDTRCRFALGQREVDGNSRIIDPADPSRIFSWLICETRDDKGNAILYEYKPEDGVSVDLARLHERNRGARDDGQRAANRYLKRIK